MIQVNLFEVLEYYKKIVFESLAVPEHILYGEGKNLNKAGIKMDDYDIEEFLDGRYENCYGHYDDLDEDILEEEDMVKCECGAEKCNITHSSWCPKYE